MADNVIWTPNPGSQTLFLTCPIFECLYEGTRGPGKTDALLMDFAQHVGQHGAAWRGILFREEYKELADVVSKSKKWFRQIWPPGTAHAARFLESKADYKWVWPSGEELLFRAAKKEDDYWDYHGHEYPWIGFEELTKWPNLDFYLAMHSCCRSSDPGMPRKIRATANPYGKGHNQVKRRFIDPAPAGVIISDGDWMQRIRIHGRLSENPHLTKNDPQYVTVLRSIKDPNKRKAWLYGDWDITSGGMFDDLWDAKKHVLRPFEIPQTWRIDRSFDWGSARPFSVGCWAESDGSPATMADGTVRHFPRGTLFRIAEWYGCQRDERGNMVSNTGLKMSDADIAKGIVQMQQRLGMKVRQGPADSSIFDEVNGDSPAKQQEKYGVRWDRADKTPGSRKRGWALIRTRLEEAAKDRPEGPGLYVFDTCRDFIALFPSLPRDDKDPDDVDTESEDHIADETRYRVLAKRSAVTTHRLRGL